MKKILLLSNYSWAFTSADIVKKHFPQGDIMLITKNMKDIATKYDFGINVVESGECKSRNRPFKKTRFEAAIIDYGFNIDIALSLLIMKFKKLYIIDLRSKDVLRLITRLEFLKIFIKKMPYFVNKILIYISKRYKMDISLGNPSEISIETICACNLKCMACPTGLGQLNRPPEPISRGLFNKITEENKMNFRFFDIIYPFIYGEPLLNKDIFEILKKLRSMSYPYTRIELHTNGNITNSKDMAPKLLLSGIDIINIAIDGTSKDAYESFRRGGDFGLVCEFVKNLSSAKRRLALFRPEIVVQMILTRYSENQLEEFKKLKDELGADRFTLKGFFHEFTGLSDEEGYSLAPSKKELLLSGEDKKEIINRKNNLCGWPYRSISIMCNGNVAPCCIDFNTSLLNGLNIHSSTIKKLWNSTGYRQFRRDMLQGKISMCNKCFLS